MNIAFFKRGSSQSPFAVRRGVWGEANTAATIWNTPGGWFLSFQKENFIIILPDEYYC